MRTVTFECHHGLLVSMNQHGSGSAPESELFHSVFGGGEYNSLTAVFNTNANGDEQEKATHDALRQAMVGTVTPQSIATTQACLLPYPTIEQMMPGADERVHRAHERGARGGEIFVQARLAVANDNATLEQQRMVDQWWEAHDKYQAIRKEARLAVANGTATPKQKRMDDVHKENEARALIAGRKTMAESRLAVANNTATPKQKRMVSTQKKGFDAMHAATIAVANGDATLEQQQMEDRRLEAGVRGCAIVVDARLAVANGTANAEQKHMISAHRERSGRGAATWRENRHAIASGTPTAHQQRVEDARIEGLQKRQVTNDAKWAQNYELLCVYTAQHPLKTLNRQNNKVRSAGSIQPCVATYPLANPLVAPDIEQLALLSENKALLLSWW
jgi:hypothetical protein